MLRKRQRGFTLIECIVAIVVVGIGLVGVVGCLTAALLANQKASQTELATAVAQGLIEDMRSRGFGSITYDDFPATEAVAGLHSGTRTITITNSYGGNSRLKLVQVSVTWRTPNNHTKSVNLETIVANKGEHVAA